MSHNSIFNISRDIEIDALGYTDSIMKSHGIKLSDICEAINRSHAYFTCYRKNGFMHRKDAMLLEKLYGIPISPYLKSGSKTNAINPEESVCAEHAESRAEDAAQSIDDVANLSLSFAIAIIRDSLPAGCKIVIEGGIK